MNKSITLSVILLSVTPNKTKAFDNSKCVQLIHVSFIKVWRLLQKECNPKIGELLFLPPACKSCIMVNQWSFAKTAICLVSTITTVNFHISLKYQCLIWKPVNVKVRGSVCYNVKISFNYVPVFQYSKKNVYIRCIFSPFTSVKVELSKQTVTNLLLYL